MYRTIVEESVKNIAVMDVFSKLIQNRIIFIDDNITNELANGVIAQMLILDSQNHDPIEVYINSPGGDVYAGLAIYDISKLIVSPIHTTCIGMAASMAAILMLMGTKRSATKHSRIMLHQVSLGSVGKLDEFKIDYEQAAKLQDEIFVIIEGKTSLHNIKESLKLDTWYTAKEAFEVNIINNLL